MDPIQHAADLFGVEQHATYYIYKKPAIKRSVLSHPSRKTEHPCQRKGLTLSAISLPINKGTRKNQDVPPPLSVRRPRITNYKGMVPTNDKVVRFVTYTKNLTRFTVL